MNEVKHQPEKRGARESLDQTRAKMQLNLDLNATRSKRNELQWDAHYPVSSQCGRDVKRLILALWWLN